MSKLKLQNEYYFLSTP